MVVYVLPYPSYYRFLKQKLFCYIILFVISEIKELVKNISSIYNYYQANYNVAIVNGFSYLQEQL